MTIQATTDTVQISFTHDNMVEILDIVGKAIYIEQNSNISGYDDLSNDDKKALINNGVKEYLKSRAIIGRQATVVKDQLQAVNADAKTYASENFNI